MKLSLHKKSILALLAFVSFAFVQELGAQCSPPNATAGTANCPGNITLTASGSTGLFRWYNQPSGGAVIATTSSYTTPSLFATSTFYVEAVDHLTAPTCSSGRVAVLAVINPIASPTVSGGGTINCGSSATLTASGSTGLFRWYDSPAGGSPIGFGTSYNTGNITNLGDTFYVEASQLLNPASQVTFNFTGGIQNWTIPSGVTSISVDLRGAQGGQGYNTMVGLSEGGTGGRVTGTLSVTPGQTISVYVGGAGANGTSATGSFAGGYNGGGNGWFRAGGGGGSTDIRIGGTALTNRVIVAGGGGGGGYACNTYNNQKGGDGGGLTGGVGLYCNQSNNTYYNGFGGTQTTGGNNAGYYGGAAGLFQGSGFSFGSYSGGGGGGYYGGGAGFNAGGGGGSSWANTNATNVSHTQGFQTGNGQVIISYVVPTCNSARVPVVVSATPLSAPTVTTLNIACGSTAPVSLTGGGPLYAFYDSLTAPLPSSIDTILTLPFLTANDTLYIGSVSGNPAPVVQNFSFTGSLQTWTVPAGVSSVTVTLNGAKGGDNTTMGSNNGGGLGGRVTALMQVTPGEVLNIYVGGTTTTWQGGWNGGGNASTSWNFTRGGGGATDIRIGGTALSNRVIVAGAGGGGGYDCSANNRGGHGGNLTGENGYSCNGNTSTCTSGRGGSQTAGGLNGGCCNSPSGHGQLGIGGNGGVCGEYGGGGGGGYFGGGGGYFAGGGGGSSWTNTVRCSNVTHTQGVQNSAGSVSISYQLPVCQSTVVPVIVNVGPLAGPVVSDTTVACGSGVTVFAGSTAQQVTWWDAPSGGNQIAQGIGLALPPVTSATTYYVQERNAVGGVGSMTFTNCGKSGNTGPDQSQCDAAYGSGVVTVVGGIQYWTVPLTGTYFIEAFGAQGGQTGGLGAKMSGEFQLTQGEVIRILVGQQGDNGTNGPGGGGGGTFVVRTPFNTNESILLAAAGGSGNGSYSFSPGLISTTAGNGGVAGGSNGNGGSGGTRGAGGGGFFTNGSFSNVSSMYANPGQAFVNGGNGGAATNNCGFNASGGFGGGSSHGGNCINNGGAGGGYSGGGGSSNTVSGGGGSYNTGANQDNAQGVRSGNGQVNITWNFFFECISPRVPMVVSPDSLPAPSISPDAFGCSPVTHTFTASGGFSNFTWYDGPVSGTANVLATGSTITNTVNDTTEYFVGYTDPNGCPSKLRKGTIFAVPSPDATVVGPVDFCTSDGTVTLQAGSTGGVWSGTGIVNALTGDFDAASLSPGQYNVSYIVSNVGCSDSSNTQISILQGPNAAITSAPLSVCEYDAPQLLSALNSNGQWSGVGVNSSGVFDPALSGAGAFTGYYTLVSSNGCVGVDSIALVVNPTPNAAVSSLQGPICSTASPIQLSAVNPGGVWTGNGVNTGGLLNPQQLAVGNHYVYHSLNSNGCISSDSLLVSVVPGAIATIASPPLSVCQNAGQVLFTSSGVGGVWSGPGIVQSNSGLFTPSLAPMGVGYVRYTVTDGPCVATDSVQVTVNPVPTATVNAPAQSGFCQGGSLSLSASGGASYSWRVNDSPIAGANQPAYTANQPGVYTVEVQSQAGCTAISTPISVSVFANPVINNLSATAVCEGGTTQFQHSSSVSGNGGAVIVSYLWDFGIPGAGAVTAQPNYTYSSAGSYLVELIVATNQGCTDTMTQQVQVNPLPNVGGLTATDVCHGNPVLFTGNSSVAPINNASIQTESWSLAPGVAAFGPTATHMYANPGVYNYTLTATTNHGCSQTGTGLVNIWANPVSMFQVSNACAGANVVLNNLSSGNIGNYSWSFGDGGTDIIANPVYVYSAPGSYTIQLTVTSPEGCQSVSSKPITIAPTPSSEYSYTPLGGLDYLFSSNVVNPVAMYTWSFGDGTVSTQISPVKTYAFSGNYTVCLNVTLQECSSSTCEVLNITSQSGIEDIAFSNVQVFPNPFSGGFTILLSTLESSPVSWTLRDLSGRMLSQKSEGVMSAGSHALWVDTTPLNLPAGVYSVEMNVGGNIQSIRVVHLP